MLKLDMAKAYDWVSWFFLLSVMRRMGFYVVWIDFVFWAVSNIWYSVVVNGVKEGLFTSTPGLQQGNPLSPNLFILAAEVLFMFVAQVYLDRCIPRFSQTVGTLHIHYITYTNDVVIFRTGHRGGGAFVRLLGR